MSKCPDGPRPCTRDLSAAVAATGMLFAWTRTGRSGNRQYISVKRILLKMPETCRTGSAGRCDLLAYNQVHAGRACTRLPSHDRVFEGHGFREPVAGSRPVGTSHHSPTVSLTEKYWPRGLSLR